MTDRQRRFVEAYLENPNATSAATRAGFSARTASSAAQRLLKNVQVAAAIAAGQAARAAAAGLTAAEVLEELRLIGFADMRDYVRFDPHGAIAFDWSHMPASATRAVSEVSQEEITKGKGKHARVIRKTRFKLHSKPAALTLIAQHLGMLVNRSQLLGKDGKPIDPPTGVRVEFVDAKAPNT